MVYQRTIRLADTDAAGVTYFAAFLSICHEAYEASLEEAGISLRTIFEEQWFVLPVIHAQMDFLRPLYCGDRIKIVLSPRHLSENEFEIEYLITGDSEPEQRFAQGKTRHVCIDPKIRRRIPLPASVITWLEGKDD